MTWLALCDHDDRRFSLHGLGRDKKSAPQLANDPRLLVTRGSLLFETRLNDSEQPQALFGFTAEQPWKRNLMFRSIPCGGVQVEQVLGGETAQAEIKPGKVGRTDYIRITYSWDTTARWARMTLELPQELKIASVIMNNPSPLMLGDLQNMMLGGGNSTFSQDMVFAAFSDAIEPVGPLPTLLPDTPLRTPWGYESVGNIRRGDTMNTRDSGVVPVIHHLSRNVPARGSFRPIRLRAPYFGLNQDITVSPEQLLLIDGPEVEYLFGQEAVLVPARHLANGFTGYNASCGPIVSYHQLLLPRHDTLLTGDAALESLYIGRIRRDPVRLESSILNGLDRSALPEHGCPSHQVLRDFEAIHLARQRAA